MADDTSTTDAATDATKTTDDKSGKTFTQEQVNDLIAKEKGKFQSKYGDYDDLKVKASKLDDLETANQSELERATGERDKFKAEAQESAAKAIRLEVAVDKKLPSALVPALQGKDKAEMEAHAEELLKLVKSADATDFDGGARASANEPKSMDARIRQAAGHG